jgi:hypothetical protein
MVRPDGLILPSGFWEAPIIQKYDVSIAFEVAPSVGKGLVGKNRVGHC